MKQCILRQTDSVSWCEQKQLACYVCIIVVPEEDYNTVHVVETSVAEKNC